jgi:hypothetical protein
MPKFTPAELGFIQLVSYLYVLYFEVGRVGVSFLEDRFDVYSVDAGGIARKHRPNVRDLRTYFQHNLNPLERRDKRIQEQCEDWYESACGSRAPAEEHHWLNCTQTVLKDAAQYLIILAAVVREIERDESRDAICRQWASRVNRYHPPEAFDDIIIRVARDMGRDGLDPVRLRTRFYDGWTRELEMLQEGYDFETEARRLIELAILMMREGALPITGRDIMGEFHIPPGPRVGALLEVARGIHNLHPCSRDELIELLRGKIAPENPGGV